MAKSVPRDSQILLKILQVQKDMQSIIEGFESYEEISKDSKAYDLLYLGALKIISMSKNAHGSTKKEGLEFLDAFTDKLLFEELTYCYPNIGKLDLIKYFNHISDDGSMGDVMTRYAHCITKSSSKDGSGVQ